MILRKHPGSDIFSMSKAETLTNRNGWTGLMVRFDTNRVYFKHPAWGPPWIIPSSVYFGHTMRMPPRKVLQQDIFLTPAADTSAELSEYRYNLEVRYGCFRGSFREVTYFQYPRWKFWPTRTDASAD